MGRIIALAQTGIMGFIAKTKHGRAFLSFIRDNKLKDKLIAETSWFLSANLIFSASTYMIGFLVPYILNTNYMAYFTAGNQITLVLSMVLEFGISLSFLRFYQIDKDSKYIYSFLQIFLLLLLIIAGLFFYPYINPLLNIDELPVSAKLFYIIVIGQYGWGFIKTWLLATNKIKTMTVHAVLIFVLRGIFLIHLFYVKDFSVADLFLETLFYPFLPSLLHQLYLTLRTSFEAVPLLRNRHFVSLRVLMKKVYDYMQFSILTYLANFIFLYTGRYLIIYLTGKNNEAIADLGYAMTFLGIILVFYTTIRNYLVARLNMNRVDLIKSYVQNLKNLFKFAVFFFVVMSFALSYIVMLIKPHYLTFNTVLFAFIFFLSNFINSYVGLFTVLSKTYDFNKLELFLNVIRFLIVVAVTNLIVPSNLLLGVILINVVMVSGEYVFASIILKRINYAQFKAV